MLSYLFSFYRSNFTYLPNTDKWLTNEIDDMRPTKPKADDDSLAFVYLLSIGAATMSELGNVSTSISEWIQLKKIDGRVLILDLIRFLY